MKALLRLVAAVLVGGAALVDDLPPLPAHPSPFVGVMAQERTLPPDQWCAPGPDRLPQQHHCDCKRSCVQDPDGSLREVEDPQCTVYCSPKSCRCARSCP